MGRFKPVRSDTRDYEGLHYYGILNEQGDFWSPMAFATADQARQFISAFWSRQPEMQALCLRTHKIVPVRVRLETLPIKGGQT